MPSEGMHFRPVSAETSAEFLFLCIRTCHSLQESSEVAKGSQKLRLLFKNKFWCSLLKALKISTET